MDAPTAYALFDGVFLNALTSHTYGTAGAVDRLGSVGVALLPALVGLPS